VFASRKERAHAGTSFAHHVQEDIFEISLADFHIVGLQPCFAHCGQKLLDLQRAVGGKLDNSPGHTRLGGQRLLGSSLSI
jgi:hypothetical protein